eukprot:scaffold111334_cov34-Tisochrysis_lutea.AAC.6
MHHTPNPHGVTTAWSWIARVLNQKPQRITATILLAFLKPCVRHFWHISSSPTHCPYLALVSS